jgi:dienelactone hydrolase
MPVVEALNPAGTLWNPMDLLRESIRTFLKLSPLPNPPAIHIVNEAEGDRFRRSLIRYSAHDGEQIEAFLLEPKIAEPRGAVLALHQHNSQWAIGKSEVAGLMGDPLQAFGPALARRGITVLAPDSIGFESRMKKAGWGTTLAPALSKSHSTEEGWLQYYTHVAHRLVRGELLMRDILADCEIALSILHGRTKNSHLGVVGHSFGGTVALFLAALDTRVAFACASGAVCSFRHKLAAGTALEGSLIIPGFHERFDLDDLLRCVAPRRILVVSSESDPYSADASDLVKTALPAFEMQQCGDRLEHLRVPGPHALDQGRFDAILNWTVANATCS